MQILRDFRASVDRRGLLLGAAVGGASALVADRGAVSEPRVTSLGQKGSVVTAAPPVGDSAKDTASVLAAVDQARRSGVAARLQRGTYYVDSLRLPSGTDLDLNGATIRQVHPTAGSDLGAAVRNADFVGGNTRIAIYNGIITLGPGARGRIVAMENVQQLTLVNLTVSKGTGDFADWMLYVRNAQDVIISDCTVTGGTELGEDGIHLEACRRVFVDRCTVSAGDDAFAVVQQSGCPTVSSDILVTNCRFSSLSAYVTRISVYPGEKHGIYGLRMLNCVGTLPRGAKGNAMIVNDDSKAGKIAHLEVSGFPITSSTTTAGGVLIRSLRASSFGGLSVAGVGGRSIDIRNSSRVSFENCVASGVTAKGGEGWWIENCSDVGLVACTSMNSPVAGFTVAGSTSSRVSFTSCRSTNAGTYGWTLFTAANIRFIGCATSGARLGTMYDQMKGRAPRVFL